MNKRVLVIGSNSTLLDTRRGVLEANGIAAETKLFNFTPNDDFVAASNASVVVVCSSLSAASRQTVLDFAHAAIPKLPCLVVVPNYGESVVVNDVDAVVEALAGPKTFISRIEELISRSL